MAALHGLRLLRHQFTGVAVQYGGGAGIERGVDGEDQHEFLSTTTCYRIRAPPTAYFQALLCGSEIETIATCCNVHCVLRILPINRQFNKPLQHRHYFLYDRNVELIEKTLDVARRYLINYLERIAKIESLEV
jgi:hypothetical protein